MISVREVILIVLTFAIAMAASVIALALVHP